MRGLLGIVLGIAMLAGVARSAEPPGGDDEPAASLPERQQSAAVTEKMIRLLGERRFDELDRWITRYLDEDPTFPSGRYKLKATNKFIPHKSVTAASELTLKKFVDDAEAWLAAKPDSLAAKLVLGRMLIDYGRIIKARGGREAPDLHRRALEYVYEIEQVKPKLSDVHRTYIMLMFDEGWDLDTGKATVLKAVDSGAYCPQIVGEGLIHLRQRLPEDDQRAATLRTFFDECVSRMPEKYRAAMPAACFKDLIGFAANMKDYAISWPEMRAGFEALDRLYPNSTVNDWAAAYFASRAGDREFTARMFARLGNVAPGDDIAWDAIDLNMRRTWAAPNYADGDQRQVLEYIPWRISQTQWLPDGQIFFTDEIATLGALDPKTGVMTTKGRWSRWVPREVRLSDDARTAAYSNAGGYVALRTFPQGDTVIYAKLPGKAIGDEVAASPDALQLAVADITNLDLVVYRATNEEVKQEREPDLRRAKAMSMSCAFLSFRDDGRQIVGLDNSGLVQIWRSEDLEPVHQWQAHSKPREALAAISADGKRLATYGADKFVRVWSLPDGARLAEFKLPGSTLGALDFSPDGRLLAGGEANRSGFKPCTLYLWDVDAKKLTRELRGHKGSILNVDFSADGRSLLTSAVDMSIRVWDVPTE